jgi:hypothetical protein
MGSEVKLQEYATEEQIEFFDRLRSGDDPEHEDARIELVGLADETLRLLGDLRVDNAAHDAGVRRILTKLNIIAGNKIERFILDIVTDGYDVSDADLMGDLKDEAKARFDEDEKMVLALLAEPDVSLDDIDNDYGCVGAHRYSFSTMDPVVAEKYGFMGEAEREAEAQEARERAEKNEATRAKKHTGGALIQERGPEYICQRSVEPTNEAAVQQIQVVEKDAEKQTLVRTKAVEL